MFQSDNTNSSMKGAEDAFLDARGLICPLPLLKAKMALSALATGQTLKVLATDEGSVRDFHSFCELTSHELIAVENQDGGFSYIIRKG